MVGTVVTLQPADSIGIGIAGDGSAGQRGLEAPNPGSEASCSSCGASIELAAALCPWCGRVVLKDAVAGSAVAFSASPWHPVLGSSAPGSIDAVLVNGRDST
jgi:hypothetical protein